MFIWYFQRAWVPYGYLWTWNWPITAHEISQPCNKYLLLAECEVCIASYGLRFFFFYGPSAYHSHTCTCTGVLLAILVCKLHPHTVSVAVHRRGGGVVEVAWGGRGEVKYLTYDFFTKSHTLGHFKPTFEICLVKRFLLALDWWLLVTSWNVSSMSLGFVVMKLKHPHYGTHTHHFIALISKWYLPDNSLLRS